jgi:hypothetical protein
MDPTNDTSPAKRYSGSGFATLCVNVQAGSENSVGWELALWILSSEDPANDIDRLARSLAAEIALGRLGPRWSAKAYPDGYAIATPASRVQDPFRIGSVQSASITLIPVGEDSRSMGWRTPQQNSPPCPHVALALAAIHQTGICASQAAANLGGHLAMAFENAGPHSMATIPEDAELARAAISQVHKLALSSAIADPSTPRAQSPSL